MRLQPTSALPLKADIKYQHGNPNLRLSCRALSLLVGHCDCLFDAYLLAGWLADVNLFCKH